MVVVSVDLSADQWVDPLVVGSADQLAVVLVDLWADPLVVASADPLVAV